MTTAHAHRQALDWLTAADRVLVTAGAGLSAAAGYNYGDTRRFAELFPALHRAGFTARYEFINPRLPDEILWGFWAIHVDDIRFDPAPNPLYQRLREVVADRDYFVMTSNVDQLFARNGFDADRIFTPQGDYAYYQCFRACTRQVWPTEGVVAELLPLIDPQTGAVPIDRVPWCRNCGGRTFLNVNIGRTYISDRYDGGLHALNTWLAAAESPIVILEIGAGMNTPSVIRWPDEHLAGHLPDSRLIRVNPQFADVPTDLGDRAVAVPLDALAFLAPLTDG